MNVVFHDFNVFGVLFGVFRWFLRLCVVSVGNLGCIVGPFLGVVVCVAMQ